MITTCTITANIYLMLKTSMSILLVMLNNIITMLKLNNSPEYFFTFSLLINFIFFKLLSLFFLYFKNYYFHLSFHVP